jgi:uncharacterized protein (DUF488 family)
MNEVLTIGHSHHSDEEFVRLLQQHGITAIADVRSHPYSRIVPQFNRETFRTFLTSQGIHYVFLGEELGARRTEPECYSAGRVRYPQVAHTLAFQRGLGRVRKGAATHRIALLCAEKDPITCHRSILVCRHLRQDLAISHIREDGTIETHAELESRLLDLLDLPPGDLFHTRDEMIEQAYDRQGERIAYVEPEPDTAESEP